MQAKVPIFNHKNCDNFSCSTVVIDRIFELIVHFIAFSLSRAWNRKLIFCFDQNIVVSQTIVSTSRHYSLINPMRFHLNNANGIIAEKEVSITQHFRRKIHVRCAYKCAKCDPNIRKLFINDCLDVISQRSAVIRFL